MNAAHLHIILVHLPIVLIPTGAIILTLSLLKRSSAGVSIALLLLVCATILAVPPFLLGEGAEEIVEDLPGISEDVIEEHEEAADIAFWLTIATGLLGAGSLTARRMGKPTSNSLALATVLASYAASTALLYTANQGGKIRHPEAYATESRGTQEVDEAHH